MMLIKRDPIKAGEKGSVMLLPINVAGIIPGSAPSILEIRYFLKSKRRTPRYILTASDGKILIIRRKNERKNES